MRNDQRGFAHVLLVIGLVVAIAVVIGVAVNARLNLAAKLAADVNHPPQFIEHDFIDLAQIVAVSKFRSVEGHDYSAGGETCRSMKNYYTPTIDDATRKATDANGGMPPKPDGKSDINIYSPVTGKISEIVSERTPIGEQIHIVPDAAPGYTVVLFHVYKQDGVKAGTRVTAGQKLGIVGRYTTEIAVMAGLNGLVSYFSVMPDSVFAAYKERGASSRGDFIISKEYRDAHPVPCNQGKDSDQAFHYPDGYDFNTEEFHLSGYEPLPNNPLGGAMGSGNSAKH